MGAESHHTLGVRLVGGPVGLRARAGSSDRSVVGRRSIGCLVLPADRSERSLEHPANPNGLGPDVELIGALMQSPFGVRRTIALPQIVVPGRAMVTFGP